MATLQELESRFQELKDNLAAFEEQKNKAIEELRNAKINIKALNKNIRDLNNQINAFDTVISKQTDSKEKEKLEKQKGEIEKELAEKTAERDRIVNLGKAKTEAEENIVKANGEIQSIIDEFASDPRINAHLQEAISIKYDEQVELKEKEKENKEKLTEKFSLDLQNDKVFGSLVSDLVKKYSEYKKIPTFTLDEDSKKKASSVRSAFSKSVTKLTTAIANRPEYADLVLTEEDFEAIVAGPNSEGKYEIPSMQEAIVTIDKTIADLSDKKTKVIEKIQKALASERIDAAEAAKLDDAIKVQDEIISNSTTRIADSESIIEKIDKDIEVLKATFATVDTTEKEKALKDSKDDLQKIEDEYNEKTNSASAIDKEIDHIDTEIAAIGFDKKKLEDLRAKANIPDELLEDKKVAQEEYDEAINALKNKGYINEDIYPALNSSECKTAFDTFKSADLKVREAFLKCETNNTDEAKKELKAAMEAYKVASNALLNVKGMEGLTVENWHDYLISQLNEEAENGELNEVYYSGVLESRLDNVAEECELEEGELETELSAVRNAAKVLSDQQEAFLKGEKVEFADVEKNLEAYNTTIKGLFDGLKNAGIKTISTVEDLYGKLREKLQRARKSGFFSRLGARFKRLFKRKNSAKTIIGTKTESEQEEIDDLLENLDDKMKALEDSKDNIEEHLETTLSEDEINEFNSQEEKESKVKGLDISKKEKTAQRTYLGTKMSQLLIAKANAEKLVAEKQKELDDAKANGTATPEQQNKLNQLLVDKAKQETVKGDAENAKNLAMGEKNRLQGQKAALKPTMPKEVVKNARNVAHGEGQELTKATLDEMER